VQTDLNVYLQLEGLIYKTPRQDLGI
jgi:hypothetical protein